ncbi:hypothetical protein KI387_000580, partial [Taxus chinensis]
MPWSKNNFRAKVRQDTTGYGANNLSIDTDGFSANMEKGVSDLEMGVKPSWPAVGIGASEDSQGQNLEGIDTRSTMHPRRSGWGRKSGSWEIPLDILALAAGVGGEGGRAGTKTSPGNGVKTLA